MQKKAFVLVLVLALALAIVFAACSGKDDEPTTTFFSFTPNISSTDPSASGSPSGESMSNQDQNSTVILTTQPGETMLTVATTAFVPEAPSDMTTLPTTPDPNVPLTIPSMTAPPVNTSSNNPYYTVSPTLPTSPYTPYVPTQPTSSYVPNITTASPTVPSVTQPSSTTTQPAPTTAAVRRATVVVINDIATTSDKKMIVAISPGGWDGSFQNNSQTISVQVNGEPKSAPASISSSAKDADGNPYITIDLSQLSIPEGSYVKFTVPSAFLQTSSGAQYNKAFSDGCPM